MAVGLRRRGNPFGATNFFGYDGQDEDAHARQPMGFEQVAGVGAEQVTPPDEVQPELIQPVEPQSKGEEGFFSRVFGGGGDDGGQPSQSQIERRMKLAQSMIDRGQEDGPPGHPLQSIGRAVSQIAGSWMQGKAERQADAAEKSRREALKAALGQGGDIEALADNLLKSNDPAMVDQGLEIKLKIAMAGSKRREKPTIEDFIEGEQTVQKQFDHDTGEWKEVGRGPRFSRQVPGISITNSGGDKPPFSEDVADVMAYNALRGDPRALTGLSRANGGAQLRQVMESMVKIGKAQGLSNDQIGSKLAMVRTQYQGFMSGQRAVGTRGGQLELAATAAKGMGEIAKQQSRKVQRGQFMPLNRVQQAIERNTGDKDIVAFNAAVNSFVNAYARAITPVGAPTDASRDKAYGMLSTAMSQEQFDNVMRVLDAEMDTELAAVQQVRENLGDDFMGDAPDERDSGPVSPPAPPQASAPPPKESRVKGKTYDTPRGPMIWTGTGWRPAS